MTMSLRATVAAVAMLVATSAAQAAERTITLDVDNASCVTCAPIIKGTLARLPGVRQVAIKEDDGFTSAVVTVTFDDAKVTPAALTTAVTNAGYPATVHTAPASAR